MRRLALAITALALLAPAAGAHPESPDCDTGWDAGDHYNAATLIPFPADCAGQLNDTWDSTDFYRFDCPVGTTVTVTLTSATLTINLRAFPPVPIAPFVHPPMLAADSTREDGEAVVRFHCYVPGEYRLQLLNGGLEQDLLDLPYALTVE